MSQVAPYFPGPPDEPDQPAPISHRLRAALRSKLLLVPLGIVVLLIAIPGGTYVFAASQLSQAQSSQAAGAYSRALGAYATVHGVAGNPLARPLLGDLNDRALTGIAETHLLWGTQLKQQGKFADSETHFHAVAQSGIADLAARGNAALADLFIAWGQSLVASHQFQAGIDKYKEVATYDPAGNLSPVTNAGLAAAYAGYAQWYTQQQPPDYVNALVWYETLKKEFPDSPQAKLAAAEAFPQTLFKAGLAFVQQQKYQQAVDAMNELVKDYPTTSWAGQANAALHAPQWLTGKLIVSDQNPTPVANRLLRIASKWQIVKAHTYDDHMGQTYSTSTDAGGNFKIDLPPGQYLITWYDPSRSTFVTTFVSDIQPVNVVTINPLQPASTTVASS